MIRKIGRAETLKHVELFQLGLLVAGRGDKSTVRDTLE
jgi:hypothetical protein